MAENKLHVCFIICPLGELGSPERSRSDALLKHIYTPVLSAHNYIPMRADQISKSGLITTQIINQVIECPLVIADLTGANPNVFYELAIRHATGKPYIQLIEHGNRLPFDIGGVRTISVNHRDLDSVELCKAEIGKYITNFNEGYKPDSPISTAANVRLLQSDPRFAEDLLAKLEAIHGRGWASIDDLADKLDDIESKLRDIETKLEELS